MDREFVHVVNSFSNSSSLFGTTVHCSATQFEGFIVGGRAYDAHKQFKATTNNLLRMMM